MAVPSHSTVSKALEKVFNLEATNASFENCMVALETLTGSACIRQPQKFSRPNSYNSMTPNMNYS